MPFTRLVACAWLAAAVLSARQLPAQESAAATPAAESATALYAAAAALHNRGLYDLAAEEWSRFLERHADDARADRVYLYRGVCHLQSGRPLEAARDLQRVLAEFPQSDQREHATFYLGISLFRAAERGERGHLAEAERVLAEFSEQYPKSAHLPDAVFYLAESQYAAGAVEAALASYQRFLKHYARHDLTPDVLYGLGVAQAAAGQDSAATFANFLRTYPQHRLAAEVRLRLAESLADAGKLAEAEESFRRASETADFALADLALLRLAECLEQQGKTSAAAERFAELPRRFSQSSHVRRAALGAGRCYLAAGALEPARLQLEPLLAEPLQQESVDATHLYLLSLLKEQRFAEAVALADRLLPGLAELSGVAQLKLDRAEALYAQPAMRREALDAYEAVAEDAGDGAVGVRALYAAALTAQQLGDHERAIALAERFAERYAGDPLRDDVEFVAAESLVQLGRYDAASQRYRALLTRSNQEQTRPTYKLRAAWACYLGGHPRQVLELLDSDASEFNEANDKAESLYLLGQAHAELNEFAEAKSLLARSWQASPDWRRADETLLELARVERALNESGTAAEHLQEFARRFPESRLLDRATLALADLSFAQGDHARAENDYRRVVERWPQSEVAPRAELGLAWSQLKQKDAAGSETTATRLLDRDATQPAALQGRYVRALARYEQQQFPGAIADLTEFIKTASDRGQISDARYALALCQLGAGDSNGAISTLIALLQEDPEYSGADRARYELAWAYRSADQPGKAAEVFAALAELHPQSGLAAEALYQVGQYAYDQGHMSEAATALRACAQRSGITPLGEKSLHRLGWTLYRQEQLDEAARIFADQIRQWPQGELLADARFMQGEILFKQGRLAEALERLAAVDRPSDPEFRALALLHAGQAAAQLKDFSQASELLRRGSDELPDSRYLPEMLYERGWAAQQLGQIDEALRLYEQVTTATTRAIAARARFMIGEIHFERADHKEAVRNFFKVAYGYDAPEWQAAAQFESGRCFEVLGKKDQAMMSYQEVVSKFPHSEQAPLASERLAALK
jgi:TolA-binding protein